MPARDLQSSFVIILKEVPKWNPEFYTLGMRLAVTRVRRNPVEALSPDINSGNYLNNILGVSEAWSWEQTTASCSTRPVCDGTSNSNVFFVIGGQL